jgi:hypothetical protein
MGGGGGDPSPSLVGSLGFSCWYKRFLFCLGWSSRPSKKKLFSLPYTILLPLSPSPSKLGRQPCWVACLILCVSALNWHVGRCPPPNMGRIIYLSHFHFYFYSFLQNSPVPAFSRGLLSYCSFWFSHYNMREQNTWFYFQLSLP